MKPESSIKKFSVYVLYFVQVLVHRWVRTKAVSVYCLNLGPFLSELHETL